jgi:large subunit ribosomal protein L29
MALHGNDLRQLSVDELERRAEELRRSLFNLRLRLTTKEVEDTCKIRHERHDLARVLTILTEKRRETAAS